MNPSPLIWLADAGHLEHAVVDADVVAAGRAGRDRVVAVCSTPVQLCSLATPPASRCPACDAAFARGRAEGASDRGDRGSASRWWRRARGVA